ncbi:MAG: glutamate-5-semialdehyde dehydrogenase [Bacteroidales bacterium]|nr:glutamate-5-semialdehyde dehydrogenase [Bacteroidales bacterium]
MSEALELIRRTRQASACLSDLDDTAINRVLCEVADAIDASVDVLLGANAKDLSRMEKSNPLYDRLLLNKERLKGIAGDVRNVSTLPTPLGTVLSDTVRPNGLHIRRVSVPYGVIGVIYEARPNVTFDVFSLCFKTGNACVLKGGKDADDSNRAIVALIKGVLRKAGIDEEVINLLPATHEATGELLSANGLVDVVIPRGSRRLIDFVRENAKVPCIETGAGVVNTYFDKAGDLEKGKRIVFNAKTRRVSVCNALDCLLIARERLCDLPALVGQMPGKNVELYADAESYAALEGKYPAALLKKASPEDFGREFMDYKMAIRTVSDVKEATAHIARYGSGHSESIVTEDAAAADFFRRKVDAACVYVNAPTAFTDGAQFGLGAEIGISTQKLGARGPMGLAAMTTYKWLIDGDGQVRP